MRLPKIPAATLAATLLALVATAGTADAGYRVAHDRCKGPGLHLAPGEGSYALVCTATFEIPPHRTWADPVTFKEGSCPGDSMMPNEGVWDYWVYRGEWVTWNGFYREAYFGHAPEGYARPASFVAPFYHNWSSWNWPTRTIERCAGGAKWVPKFAVARLTVADPEPDVPDHVADHGNGNDVDHGTSGDDVERGGKGDDRLEGGAGDDELLGGAGADDLWGGDGSDELFDDHGQDHLHGGPGNDRFSTKDGNHDTVDCGDGEDVAVGDPHDTFTHCEHVYTTPENTPAQPPVVG